MSIRVQKGEPKTMRVSAPTAIIPQSITDAISANTSAIVVNTSAITAEINARTYADSALQSQIDTLDSDKVPVAREIATTGLATGGGTLNTDRVINVPISSEVENLAGTNNAKALTPLANRNALKIGLNAFGSEISVGSSDNFDVVLKANNAERFRVKGTIANNCSGIASHDLQIAGITVGRGVANNSIVLGVPSYAVGTVTGSNNVFLGNPTSVPLTLANAVYIGGSSSMASAVNNSVTIADGSGNKRIEIDGSGHAKMNADVIVMGDLFFEASKNYGITFDNSTRMYLKLSGFNAQGWQNIGGSGTRITCAQYSAQATAAVYPVYSFNQSDNSGLYLDQSATFGIVKVGISTEAVRRFYIGSDEGTFTVPIKATGYKSSDGSTGATGTATSANTLTIKNGLIVAIT